MKISLNWLRDYIDIGHSAEEIAEMLSDLGLPCEGIEQLDDDVVIDAEVTSNRGDCLGYIGIARELAAVTGKELQLPAVELAESDRDVSDFAGVEIAEPGLCCRYTARVIEGVTAGPSPEWMVKRLEAVGLRSVNNIVDATNYAMMETGQPPHAFDYDKIAEGRIIVRRAAAGERIVSIDGTQCDLAEEMLIIADAKGPVAIAGVMGGLETEVSDTTRTILLEDAYFDPVSVRTTSRKLSLPSEASFRFERTVDIEAIDWASKRTAQLIIQVAGGKAAKGVVDAYPKRKEQKQVTLRPSKLNKLLGIEVSPERVVQILSALKFEPQRRNESIVCKVPPWRSDVYREVDLIEEVARVYNYNKIPTEEKIEIRAVPVDHRQKLTQSVGTYLNGCGFFETITVGFVDADVAELFSEGGRQSHLGVRDVSRKAENILRPNLIGSLLAVLKTNINAKNLPCRIFEIADTFAADGRGPGELPTEKTKLAMVCDSDIRDLRGAIEGLIKNINKDAEIALRPAELIWARTGAEILVNGKVIGSAGVVSQKVRERFGFKEVSPAAAELEFDQLMGLQKGPVKVKPIARFPAIERDLSLIVDEQVRWADIIEAVGKKAPEMLEEIQFADIYRGKGIASGKKSITLSLRFRDEDGTLTHETVDNFQNVIVDSLTDCVKAQLRTL
jgi:phenylalanyl-tRNA synthetase beta chain